MKDNYKDASICSQVSIVVVESNNKLSLGSNLKTFVFYIDVYCFLGISGGTVALV